MTSNPWKEASTLIMVARASIAQKVGPDLAQNLMITSRVVQAADKQSIKASKNLYKTDYRVLMVKRSNLSSFMASAYVFPGGHIEISDFSPKWWDIFSRFGMNKDELTSDIRSRVSGPRPPLLELPLLVKDALESGDLSKDHLIPEIALRIAAIRETFEEAGVPILRKLSGNAINESAGTIVNTDIDLSAWRNKTRHNGSAFLELCSELNLCPDIWSLYEWWDWLTPISVGHKRFDTMFYLCCLDKQPEVVIDNAEVTNLKWCTPKEILKDHKQEGVFLAPPQVYELARIDNLNSFNSIQEFARKREKHGIERWMPVIATYSDGAISSLPGDDLYPAEPDLVGLKPVPDYPQTLQEMRTKSKNMNRIELTGPISNCVCNRKLSCGHLSPITDSPVMHSVQSML
ncbi:acyl-coenzyme A diphosphatase NUDT19-like [Brevipalpus obovatus]|uniref:acyl-coenzyme A diphosphatase NUDT19-like n=1 Tax=Brevipalpus obovatus TaxID=246614 RepID=UPI003D9E8872